MTEGTSSLSTTSESPVHLKRALGVWDLTWLAVVAIANLNVVPVIAASGPTTMWLWAIALAFFFLPQGVAVIELSRLLPAEGGVYVWSKEMFGDLHGFVCGWCYWTANMFFIPSLLFYLLGMVSYSGGPVLAHAAENPLIFGTFAIGLLWLTAFANMRGMGVGKWVNNAGGIGTLIAALILIALGAACVARFGPSVPASAFRLQHMDSNALSCFGVICFGLVGLELGCVMGDEIRDPERSVPRGVLYGGSLSAVQYVGATLALILALPKGNVTVLQGVLQGVDSLTAQLHAGWMLLPIALLIAISVIGATSAWLSGAARILFVSGIDRYLPRVFGRIHPTHNTPHVALAGIATLSSVLIAMSFAGSSTVKEAYVTLIDLAVVLQMISYSYVFASLAKAAFGKHASSLLHPLRSRIAAVCGFVTTFFGLGLAFIPSHQVDSVWRFELKMVISCGAFIAVAVALFTYYSKRRVPLRAAVAEV